VPRHLRGPVPATNACALGRPDGEPAVVADAEPDPAHALAAPPGIPAHDGAGLRGIAFAGADGGPHGGGAPRRAPDRRL
jgi:hypothetical protein